VIVWLGDDESGSEDTQRAVNLVPKLLNLRTLDTILTLKKWSDEETARSLLAFGQFIMIPWFSRRWIIQEIACARQLSVRVSHHVMSWLDFTDAIDIFLRNTDRIRDVVEKVRLFIQNELILPSAAECSRLMVLLELSCNCFCKTAELTIKTRLMSLEALVLAASPFEDSEVRDTIYALLYMANDRKSMLRYRNP
jgi:hypothetical protein